MKLTFLGTGTSMGVPVAGGFLREKLSGDPRNERTRCSAWIETEQTSLVIDVGPEFRIQSIRSGIKKIDGVFITHEHMDHIGGLDDLRIYCYKNNAPISLFATKSCIQSITKKFDYMFGKDKYPGSTSLELNEINSSQIVGDLKITPLPIAHGELQILGFRVNDVSYLTDVKEILEATKSLIRGSKVIILSALRWEPPHPTHLTIPEAVALIQELEIPEGYLIHMNSYVDHIKTSAKLPSNIKLAYDMLSLDLI